MNARSIARVLGIVFLLAGIAGFVPQITQAVPFDAPVVTLDRAYGLLVGIFPVNAVHDGLHLLFGIWGILAALRFAASVAFNRTVVWVYGILIILGLIPITNTLFGIAPIYGNDIWLHAIILLIALWGGYGRGSRDQSGSAPLPTA